MAKFSITFTVYTDNAWLADTVIKFTDVAEESKVGFTKKNEIKPAFNSDKPTVHTYLSSWQFELCLNFGWSNVAVDPCHSLSLDQTSPII